MAYVVSIPAFYIIYAKNADHDIDDESFPCITVGLAIATIIYLIIRVRVELK